MNIKKAVILIISVLFFHLIGILWGYEAISWYDIPMHLAGGLAMGALGIAIWNEGVEDVIFKNWFHNHLKWWLLPIIILGFVSFIGILWELHEFVLDLLMPVVNSRQPDLADTMKDLLMDLLGGMAALTFWRK